MTDNDRVIRYYHSGLYSKYVQLSSNIEGGDEHNWDARLITHGKKPILEVYDWGQFARRDEKRKQYGRRPPTAQQLCEMHKVMAALIAGEEPEGVEKL